MPTKRLSAPSAGAMDVVSKQWSTATLDAGICSVDKEADLSKLDEEEAQLQRELAETLSHVPNI